jgi:SAM-dependent methyltransferase
MDEEQSQQPEFDFEAVFQVDDYMIYYRDLLTDEVTDRQAAALVEMLRLDRPLRILDLACGYGRHANRLASLGHQVAGIDFTEGFLELARQDAQARGVQVEYRQGDMRQLDYHQEFDRVLSLFTSFGYFSDEENLDVLQRVHRALRPKGLFLLDIPNRDAFLFNYRSDLVTEKDGSLMIDRNSFDTRSGRSYDRRVLIRDGVRKDKPFFTRLYNPTEISILVRQANLEVRQMFGDWDSNPVSLESRRMILIAEKI